MIFHAFTIDHDGDAALREIARRNPQAQVVAVHVHPDAPRPAGWTSVVADSTVPRGMYYVEIEGDDLK